jgi:hypothetical protein
MDIWSIFAAIWYILWTFGILCGTLVYFPHFGMLHQEKSGNPELPVQTETRTAL